MRRSISLIAGALALVACGPPELPRPMSSEQAHQRASEPAHSAASLEGEVLGVDHTAPSDALASGTRIQLRSGEKTPVVVDLAPGWYLDKQGIRYSRAERVRVQGTFVDQNGRRVFYANRVIQGGRTVELRDNEGRPLWPEQPK